MVLVRRAGRGSGGTYRGESLERQLKVDGTAGDSGHAA